LVDSFGSCGRRMVNAELREEKAEGITLLQMLCASGSLEAKRKLGVSSFSPISGVKESRIQWSFSGVDAELKTRSTGGGRRKIGGVTRRRNLGGEWWCGRDRDKCRVWSSREFYANVQVRGEARRPREEGESRSPETKFKWTCEFPFTWKTIFSLLESILAKTSYIRLLNRPFRPLRPLMLHDQPLILQLAPRGVPWPLRQRSNYLHIHSTCPHR
jgi:hypothetical protein